MSEIKRDRIKLEDLGNYGRKELNRVHNALEEAKSKLVKLNEGIFTFEKKKQIAELENAIKVGTLYYTKLKNKWLA